MLLSALFSLSIILSPCTAQISGDVIDTVDDSEIYAELSDVLDTQSYDNEVAIGLANTASSGFTFSNPRWYIDNCCNQPLPSSIASGQTGLLLFGSSGLTGPEGVFCFDIFGTTLMVCGAYSVPYNDLLSDEAFNVKIYPQSVPVNEDMWEQMYDDAGGVWNPNEGGTRSRTEFGITLTATMTTGDSCSMIIKVDSDDYDPSAPADLTYGCSYRAFDGDFCWRECHDVPPLGYCWLSRECNSASDCADLTDPAMYPCDSQCIEIVI